MYGVTEGNLGTVYRHRWRARMGARPVGDAPGRTAGPPPSGLDARGHLADRDVVLDPRREPLVEVDNDLVAKLLARPVRCPPSNRARRRPAVARNGLERPADDATDARDELVERDPVAAHDVVRSSAHRRRRNR
jgi:hypothetical protein